MQKYKIGAKHPTEENLYRIIAVRNFSDVKKGDVGGWINLPFVSKRGGLTKDSFSNHALAHTGDCWAYDNSKIRCCIYGFYHEWDYLLSKNAKIYNEAEIEDEDNEGAFPVVTDNVIVGGHLKISGDLKIEGDVKITGKGEIVGVKFSQW